MELPKRKQIRLPEYDYNSHGAYFITVCTKGRAKILSGISVGTSISVGTISRVIQQMKGSVTKRIGKSIWQARFYDHVIRSEKDYREIWEYIENNPIRWGEDKYYCE